MLGETVGKRLIEGAGEGLGEFVGTIDSEGAIEGASEIVGMAENVGSMLGALDNDGMVEGCIVSANATVDGEPEVKTESMLGDGDSIGDIVSSCADANWPKASTETRRRHRTQLLHCLCTLALHSVFFSGKGFS